MAKDDNDAQIRYWKSGPGSSWAHFQQGFDACFENFNQRLVQLCNPPAGASILDVGCGTGATSIALAKTFGNEVSITGLDVSTPLLELAQFRVESERLENITFVEADAQTYEFGGAQFDRLLSRFGVMFFSDPVIAFKNLASSIKPGGKMHFAAWSDINQNPWFHIALDIAVSRLGKPQAVDPKEPGPLAFADIDYLAEILQQAGLTDFEINEEDIPIGTSLGFDEMAHLACSLGPAVRLMKEKNATREDAEAVEVQTVEAFKAFQRGDRVEVPARIVVVESRF